MTAALVSALERRVGRDGARPLLTCYDLDTGDRVELSARTFANWVDKTVNLMASIGADDEPSVAMPLLLTHPGHWVGLVWAMAAWQVGGRVVALPREELKVVEVAVIGPDNVHPVPGAETIACSLHPLGLPFAQPPVAVTDYAEVLTQPDVHWSNVADADEVAFRGLTHESRRLGREVDACTPSDARCVVHATTCPDTWKLLERALVAPLLGGGSSVVVRGHADASDLARLAATEEAELVQQ